jgi:hypothetical protein
LPVRAANVYATAWRISKSTLAYSGHASVASLAIYTRVSPDASAAGKPSATPTANADRLLHQPSSETIWESYEGLVHLRDLAGPLSSPLTRPSGSVTRSQLPSPASTGHDVG